MDDLIQALKHLKVQTGSLACLGCGHEHSCSIHGCAIIRAAVEELENQAQRKGEQDLSQCTGKTSDRHTFGDDKDQLTVRLWKPKDTDDLKLKSCPFCGCKEPFYEQYARRDVGTRWRVICPQCMAMMDPGYAQDRHIVQAMWNRRCDPDEKENRPDA